MSRHHKPRDEVWAVVRVDEFHDESTPWRHRVTVKEIVRSEELARGEVERLTKLNAGKQCVYFATMTRLFPDGTAAGTNPDECSDDEGVV